MKALINKRKAYTIALMMILSCLAFACKKSSDNATPAPTQGANEVWIQNLAFSPASISVTVNTTVKWTNKDAVTHTVTSDGGLFDSGNLGGGATFSHQFTTAGTYPYHCNIHSNMHANVVVH